MVVFVQIAPPDFDRVFAALADHTRRDIVRRAISAEEGVVELASHYPMSVAAVQKHVRVLERAGWITKQPVTKHAVAPGGRVAYHMTGPAGDQAHGYWDILEVEPPRRILLRDACAADGTPNMDIPINTIRVGIEEVAQGRTRMSIEIVFP